MFPGYIKLQGKTCVANSTNVLEQGIAKLQSANQIQPMPYFCK